MKNVKFVLVVRSSYSILCNYYESLKQLLDEWECESIEEVVKYSNHVVNFEVFEVNKVWCVDENGRIL